MGHTWGNTLSRFEEENVAQNMAEAVNAALGWARPKAAPERSESGECGQWSREALASHCEGAREGKGCGKEQVVALGTFGETIWTNL